MNATGTISETPTPQPLQTEPEIDSAKTAAPQPAPVKGKKTSPAPTQPETVIKETITTNASVTKMTDDQLQMIKDFNEIK